MRAAVTENGDAGVKCLSAMKHAFTLILGRLDLAKLIPKDTMVYAQALVLDTFWETDPKKGQDLCVILAELCIVLTTQDSATPEFISNFLSNMIMSVSQHNLAVQLSLLCLINKCFANCQEEVERPAAENSFRILRRVFEMSSKVMESEPSEHVYPILSLSANMISTIITNQPIDVWGMSLQKELIPPALIHIAAMGIFVSLNTLANL